MVMFNHFQSKMSAPITSELRSFELCSDFTQITVHVVILYASATRV